MMVHTVLIVSITHAQNRNSGAGEIFDVEQAKVHQQRFQTSMAMLVDNAALEEKADSVLLLRQRGRLCADYPFVGQQRVAGSKCSTFLIAPRVVMTSGHCVSPNTCSHFSVVFDVARENVKVPTTSRYRCKKVHRRVYANENGGNRPAHDFAIIELDRPVINRKPLVLAKTISNPKDPVFSLGYPDGLGLKVAPGAVVSTADAKQGTISEIAVRLVAGMSGGPTLNARGEVIGINTTGRHSYVTKSGCRSLKRQMDGNGIAVNEVFQTDLVRVLQQVEHQDALFRENTSVGPRPEGTR